jgi:hypothetical protein
MALAEPKGMPSFEDAAPFEMLGDSLISIDISNHPRGSNFPALVYEPRKMAIEGNGAAVADPRGTDPDHAASDNTAADSGPVVSLLDIQFDLGTRQQPMVGLDQRAAGGHVDHTRAMSWTYACGLDAVFLERVHAAAPASIGRISLHTGFHRRVRASNFNIRVLPVSPKMRTAYCTSRRPRM